MVKMHLFDRVPKCVCNATLVPLRPPKIHTHTQLCLSKGGINFPVQLLPNNYGLTQSVGLDTAVGFAVLGAAGWARKRAGLPLVPPLRSETVPWGWKADQVKKRVRK